MKAAEMSDPGAKRLWGYWNTPDRLLAAVGTLRRTAWACCFNLALILATAIGA
jgi:hypothetical protein